MKLAKHRYIKRAFVLLPFIAMFIISSLTITAVVIPKINSITRDFAVPNAQTMEINSTSVNVWVETKKNEVPKIHILISQVFLNNLSSETSQLLDPAEVGVEEFYEIFNGDSITALFPKQDLSSYANKSRYATIVASNIPESTELKVVCTFYRPFTNNWTVNSTKFTLTHTFICDYTAIYDPQAEMLNIDIFKLKWTYEPFGFGDMVPPSNFTTAKYQIRDNNTDAVISEGDLQYESNKYSVKIPFRQQSGAYYVVFRLNGSFMSEEMIVGQKAQNSLFSYKNPFDNILLFIIIGVSVFVILGIITVIQKKKAEKSIVERKEPKKAQLEVINVDVKNLKPTRLEKSAPKKKVEKIDQNALIFNVPTWEVDEAADSSTSDTTAAAAAATGATAAAATGSGAATSDTKIKQNYNLHCIKCNSWFETDEFEEGLECPKCDSKLRLALWCKNCNLFVDVPKLAEYNCPKCNEKLSIIK